MACTTTATTTYTLLKYSRSYPPANVASTSTDWQHFTNPVLRLILDVTKTEKSEVHNVRMRVIWTIQNGGVITVNDNSEIEDMDLLAFSSLQPRQGAFMNIPLKAVYRDTTVGIRYLHPLDPTNITSFRRFQISFASQPETNAFTNSIRSICPCKLSLGAPPASQQQQRQIHTVTNPGSNAGVSQALPSEISSTPFFAVQKSQYPHGTTGLLGNQTSTVLACRYPQPHQNGNLTTDHFPSAIGTLQLSSMPPPPVPCHSQPLTLHKTSPPLDLDVSGDTVGSQSAFSQQQLTQPSSSQTHTASSSSQVSVRQDLTVELDKATDVIQTEQEVVTHPVISALREATWIYNLPLDVLERAAGDIIREDGFVPLVEKLDQLWKIKNIVGKP